MSLSYPVWFIMVAKACQEGQTRARASHRGEFPPHIHYTPIVHNHKWQGRLCDL
jgi:hypothetical protein